MNEWMENRIRTRMSIWRYELMNELMNEKTKEWMKKINEWWNEWRKKNNEDKKSRKNT